MQTWLAWKQTPRKDGKKFGEQSERKDRKLRIQTAEQSGRREWACILCFWWLPCNKPVDEVIRPLRKLHGTWQIIDVKLYKVTCRWNHGLQAPSLHSRSLGACSLAKIWLVNVNRPKILLNLNNQMDNDLEKSTREGTFLQCGVRGRDSVGRGHQ